MQNKFSEIIKKYQYKYNTILSIKCFLQIVVLFIAMLNIYHFAIKISIFKGMPLFLLTIFFKLTIAIFLFYLIMQAYKHFISKKTAAKLLDTINKDETDSYQNAYDFLLENKDDEIFQLIYTKADERTASQKFPTFSIKNWLITFFLVILGTSVSIAFNFDSVKNTWLTFYMKKNTRIMHNEYIDISLSNTKILKSKDLEINILNPEEGVNYSLFYKKNKLWRQKDFQETSLFLHNLDKSLDLFVKSDFGISDTLHVEVYEKPAILNYSAKLNYPRYSQKKSKILKDFNGNLKVLQGTKVRLSIDANNPIKEARINFSNQETDLMQRLGKNKFSYNFQVKKNLSYHISLKDILNNKNNQISKNIISIPDEKPHISIIYPGRDTTLTQNMLTEIKILASDDYGLKNLKLNYLINNEIKKVITLKSKIFQIPFQYDYVLDLDKASLFPGDRVTYWAEISDNSPESQTSLSKRYTLRFPSIEEIFKETEKAQEESIADMNKELKKTEENQENFEKQRRKFMNKEEMNWEEKKKMEEILKNQKKIAENIDKSAEEFQKLMEKFEKNEALSQETTEKMEKIQEMMNEINNEEFQKTLEKMQDSMKKMDPEVMKKAMEDFKFSLEDFSKKLDKTLELLESIKKEQSLNRAEKISEEMKEMQEKLKEQTENSEKTEDLAKEQEKISKKNEELQKEIDKLKELSKKDKQMQENLEKMQNEMDPSQEMQKSQKSLSQNQKQQAAKQQEKALEKMQKMNSSLSSMQNQMNQQGMQMQMEILKQTVERLLILSLLHEKYENQFSGDPFEIVKELQAGFEGLKITLKKLYKVPQIMFVLNKKFFYDTNFVLKSYKELFSYINDARTFKVDDYLEDIRKGLNLMIFDLQQSSQNSQQSGGSGMQQMMQQMQQMSQQQMMMNQMTQQLMQQMQKNKSRGERGISREMRNKMRQMAKNEERLKENLKRLLQNNREAQKKTHALEKIIEDLEAIAKKLRYGKLDQDLVNQQKRIHSRMLDIQKSIHKRDFSKKRKGETAQDKNWQIPDNLKKRLEKMERKAFLKKDFENFPEEYQQIIIEYLRKMNEKIINSEE